MRAARATDPRRRARLTALLPLLVLVDLMGAHHADVPTITPDYWLVPPASARRLKADPTCLRVFGIAEKSAGEPGFAAAPVDFLEVRDPLGWSLPPVWGLASATGITPMISRRSLAYIDHVRPRGGRYDLAGVTHWLTGRSLRGSFGPYERVGAAYIARNPGALPRVRLLGRPYYVAGEAEAMAAVDRLGVETPHRLVVEDPDRPLSEGADGAGRAAIVREIPERVEVATEAAGDAYLVLADTFDPGWSATLDGHPVPIRPAWITFRAVFVPRGRHTVVFRYRPAGFAFGLVLTAIGLLIALGCLAWPRPLAPTAAAHGLASGPRGWPRWGLVALVLIVLASTVAVGPDGVAIQSRWANSFHRFTWGAGIEAMRLKRSPS
jgi:hypothetical protein